MKRRWKNCSALRKTESDADEIGLFRKLYETEGIMEEIPVYLFTGFLDSGKTTLIRQTLLRDHFGEGAKTLLIVCEDGDEEYEED